MLRDRSQASQKENVFITKHEPLKIMKVINVTDVQSVALFTFCTSCIYLCVCLCMCERVRACVSVCA